MVSYCNVLLVYIAINSGKKLLQTSDPRVGASLTAFYLKSIFVNEASDYLVATYRTDTMALPKNFASFMSLGKRFRSSIVYSSLLKPRQL